MSEKLTIDYINGHDEFDGCVWFFDGKYAGHDDQIGEYDFAPHGTQREILFRHRVFRDGVTFEDCEPLFGSKDLGAWETLLDPVKGD